MAIGDKERTLNKIYQTPLHYAAEYSSNEIAKILISKGADIDARDIIYQITINYF